MPEIEWNSGYWGGWYNWESRGEEWSEIWGGSEPQWFGSLYPRLHRLLPAQSVLEIAPGFGRWTKFLLPLSREYVGIDLSPVCIKSCQEIFAEAKHARFYQNDGMTLGQVPDEAFDLVFTFDSLVHADTEVLDSYVPQILRKLSPRGVAFVHHSNAGALQPFEPQHARSKTVSAETVAAAVKSHGGKIICQEVVNWGCADPIDCFTTFCRRERQTPEPAVFTNPRFMEEAEIIRSTQAPYSLI